MSESLDWRGGATAVAVLSFDVDAESPILAADGRHADNAMAMSHQSYGPTVGVPRLLELLADYDLPASFFVPGLTADRYPATVERILEAGHEIGHHSYGHRSPLRLGADGERADFERALGALDRFGVKPRGHRAAGWEARWQTAELVIEHGLEYDSSLMGHDRPYRLATPAGPLLELPVHWSLDDWEQYAYLPDPIIGRVIESPRKVAEMWKLELEAMRRHQALFMLTCHPFLSGRPSRVEALREVIEHALSLDYTFRQAAEVAAQASRDPDLAERDHGPLNLDPELYPRTDPR